MRREELTLIVLEIWLKWWTDIGGRQVSLYASVYLLLAIGFSLGELGYAW